MQIPFEVETLDDEQFGRLLRQVWHETGEGLYIPPAHGERDNLMLLTVLTDQPGDDQYWPVGAYMFESETEVENK